MSPSDAPGGARRQDDVLDLEVASTPQSISRMRLFCVQACRTLGWADSADTVELLVSELATNSVVHALGARVQVRVLSCDLRLRVEVSDDDVRLPVPRRAAASAENGRGLALVELLAANAGCCTSARGKTCWFELTR